MRNGHKGLCRLAFLCYKGYTLAAVGGEGASMHQRTWVDVLGASFCPRSVRWQEEQERNAGTPNDVEEKELEENADTCVLNIGTIIL